MSASFRFLERYARIKNSLKTAAWLIPSQRRLTDIISIDQQWDNLLVLLIDNSRVSHLSRRTLRTEAP